MLMMFDGVDRWVYDHVELDRTFGTKAYEVCLVRWLGDEGGESGWGGHELGVADGGDGGVFGKEGGRGFWIFVRFRSGRLRGMLEGAVLRSALCRCFMIWRR